VKLPDNPGKKNEAEAKKLQGLSGAAFDREYMSHMVKDHEEALKLVQKTAQGAKDPDLRAAAQKAEPIVQDHLDMAKRVNASLGKGESKK
jgi:putative membrane protein